MNKVIFTLLEALDVPKERFYELDHEKQKQVKELGEEIINFFKEISNDR